jgi:hypothetical protein
VLGRKDAYVLREGFTRLSSTSSKFSWCAFVSAPQLRTNCAVMKRAQNVNGVEIHYVENIHTGQVLDLKIC